MLPLGAKDERDGGVVGDSDRVIGDLREPRVLLGVQGEWPEPKISCDSEVNGLSPKLRCAYLCCATPPPCAPPAGTPHPEGTRGGARGGEEGEGPPAPRTRAKRGRETGA